MMFYLPNPRGHSLGIFSKLRVVVQCSCYSWRRREGNKILGNVSKGAESLRASAVCKQVERLRWIRAKVSDVKCELKHSTWLVALIPPPSIISNFTQGPRWERHAKGTKSLTRKIVPPFLTSEMFFFQTWPLSAVCMAFRLKTMIHLDRFHRKIFGYSLNCCNSQFWWLTNMNSAWSEWTSDEPWGVDHLDPCRLWFISVQELILISYLNFLKFSCLQTLTWSIVHCSHGAFYVGKYWWDMHSSHNFYSLIRLKKKKNQWQIREKVQIHSSYIMWRNPVWWVTWPGWNVITVGWFTMKFIIDIYAPLSMNNKGNISLYLSVGWIMTKHLQKWRQY